MDEHDAIEAVSENALAYTTLPYEMKANREVVMATVMKDGYMLKSVSPTFKGDKEIVMAAVKNYGLAIISASHEMKQDKDVAMAAVMNNGKALNYISSTLKGDKDVVMAALRNNGDVFFAASHDLQRNQKMIEFAIEHGHVPTREQTAILLRPYDQFERGVKQDLQQRYETATQRQEYKKSKGAEEPTRLHTSKVGILNNQGPNISNKIMQTIRSFGPTKGGKRTRRNKRKTRR